MCVCVCARARVCVCVCVCNDTIRLYDSYATAKSDIQ